MSEIDTKGLIKALGLEGLDEVVSITVTDGDGQPKTVIEADQKAVEALKENMAKAGVYGHLLHMSGDTLSTILQAMGKTYLAILKVDDPGAREDLFHDACHLLASQLQTVLDMMDAGMPCQKGGANASEKGEKLH